MSLDLLIIEPFFTGSHKSWMEQYKKYSSLNIEFLTMKGNFWKWRMHGGAVTLAKEFLKKDLRPKTILFSDMIDVTTFLSLTRSQTAQTKTLLYFHENQLSYPWSPTDQDKDLRRDIHYGFINYTSALCVDKVLFNSNYHKNSFFKDIEIMLKSFPDYNNLESLTTIKEKSKTLYIGLDLQKYENFTKVEKKKKPLILWNHRWEYDKNPKDFFDVLSDLSQEGLEFDLAVLGESYKNSPKEFLKGERDLKKHIVHFGYAKSFQEYREWLHKADILPVTNIQDFFGISIIEAIHCKTFPLLPKRLTYPELLPNSLHKNSLYENREDLKEKLGKILTDFNRASLEFDCSFTQKFSWKHIIDEYDKTIKG